MKRNAIARLIVYSLLALVLTGVLVTGLLSNIVVDISSGVEIAVDGSTQLTPVQVSQLENLQINWAAGKVEVRTGQITEIMIRETADKAIGKPMTYRLENGTLEINHSSQKVFGPFYRPQEKNLLVVVPSDWVCREMDVEGAGVEVTIDQLSIEELSVDGAGVVLDARGNIQRLDIDGAGCDISVADRPQEINLDGAGCVLNLTLRQGCGFTLEMDGLGCELETDLPFTMGDGVYISGDGHCKIEVNGLGCEVSIGQNDVVSAAYSLRCGDEFTESLLLEALEEKYAPGTVITLKTDVLTDVDLELYVNGRFVCTQTEYRSPDGTNHWEFQFTMLNEPVVIHFNTVDGIER